MRAEAIIPWRSGDPDRERAHAFVQAWLHRADIPYWSVDSDPDGLEKFSRAKAKNIGGKTSDADVLIFHDADMLLREEEYHPLAEQAYESGRLVIGFTEYRPLTQPGSAWVTNRQLSDPWQATHGNLLVGFSVGGVIAIRRDAFEEVGGYDERFRGWGCEDFAFLIACAATLGPHLRREGSAVHLWHVHASVDQDPDDERWNGMLLGHYNQIMGLDDLRALQTADLEV